MLVIRDETPREIGQARMINIAAFDQPDDAFVVRILDTAAMVGADGFAIYWPDRI